jgi:Kdo2-lipid IVA lauroyltransferase/acyltransferase
VKLFITVWHLAEFGAAQTLLFFIGVGPLPVVLAVADIVARLVFFLWRSRREVTIDNILRAGVCRGRAEARRMGLAAFRSFIVMVAESMIIRRRLTPENWTEFVTLRLTPEAEELLRRPGLGFLAASAHIGNWDVAARAVSMIKPICVVFRPFNNSYLDRAAQRNRSGKNLRLMSRLDSNPMRLLQALAQGEIVGLMIDQHVTKGRVASQFFGRPAWTSKSVAMLYLATRAPLLLAFAIRTGPLRYEVQAMGPIHFERTGDRDKDAIALTQTLTDEIEKVARRFPDQYMWGHRRWKGHPHN